MSRAQCALWPCFRQGSLLPSRSYLEPVKNYQICFTSDNHVILAAVTTTAIIITIIIIKYINKANTEQVLQREVYTDIRPPADAQNLAIPGSIPQNGRKPV